MLSKRLQTILHKKKKIIFSVVLILLGHITQVKSQCNVALEALDIIGQEKILCNVALILLGPHYNVVFMQSCLSDSRHKCTGKSPVWVMSLFGNFYFAPVNILTITSCCKCYTNIAQILLTLHKKNPGPTLNK